MISNAFAFQNKDFLLDAQKTFSIQQREMQRYYHCSFSLLTKEIIMSSLLWRDYYKMWDMSENKWDIYIYIWQIIYLEWKQIWPTRKIAQ